MDIHYDWKADTTAAYKVNRYGMLANDSGVMYNAGDVLSTLDAVHSKASELKLLLQNGIIVRSADYGLPPFAQGK